MNLVNLTPEIDVSGRKVRQSEVNRPALELTGYFDHFAAGRIQLIGLVEHSYIDQMSEEDKRKLYQLTESGREVLSAETARIERLYRNSRGEYFNEKNSD